MNSVILVEVELPGTIEVRTYHRARRDAARVLFPLLDMDRSFGGNHVSKRRRARFVRVCAHVLDLALGTGRLIAVIRASRHDFGSRSLGCNQAKTSRGGF